MLLFVFGGWALESIHYAALLTVKHVGAPGVGLLGMYLRVFVGGLPLVFARLFLLMAGLWLASWLAGARIDGKRCLEAAAYATPVIGVVMAALAPLATVPDYLVYINVSYAASMAASALGLVWGAREAGVEAPLWRLAAASVFASLLVYVGPAAMATPQARLYGLVYSVLHG